MEALIIGLVIACYGVAYAVYYLYGKKKPRRKFYDHYWYK